MVKIKDVIGNDCSLNCGSNLIRKNCELKGSLKTNQSM